MLVLGHYHLRGSGALEDFFARPINRGKTMMFAVNARGFDGSALEPMIHKLEYRGRLSAADRAALLAVPHTVKRFENQHYVVRERDQATYCGLMVSGFSVRHKIVGSGLRQIVAIHMKGEMVDLQNSMLGIADHSVQMLTAGQVAMIPRDAIERIAAERP